MSVTDRGVTDPTAEIRNRRAVIEAEIEHAVAEPIPRFALELHGDEDRARTARVARLISETSYRCASCDHVFEDGDVLHRRRQTTYSGFGPTSPLDSFCESCVQGWHPSWFEHRRDPIPCAGGCGVLVSHWYADRWSTRDRDYVPAISTCSRRCTDRVQAERRRAKQEARRCAVCGEDFTPKRSDARYCSNACRQDGYRKRKHGGEPAA